MGRGLMLVGAAVLIALVTFGVVWFLERMGLNDETKGGPDAG